MSLDPKDSSWLLECVIFLACGLFTKAYTKVMLNSQFFQLFDSQDYRTLKILVSENV